MSQLVTLIDSQRPSLGLQRTPVDYGDHGFPLLIMDLRLSSSYMYKLCSQILHVIQNVVLLITGDKIIFLKRADSDVIGRKPNSHALSLGDYNSLLLQPALPQFPCPVLRRLR